MELLARRKLTNQVALTLSLSAMAFGLFWLAWILVTVLQLGIDGLTLSLFTEMTPPPGAENGGLLNAIVGSLILVGLGTLVGTPIGIMAGIYLAEYGRYTWLGRVTRFVNDLLLSAPGGSVRLPSWYHATWLPLRLKEIRFVEDETAIWKAADGVDVVTWFSNRRK